MGHTCKTLIWSFKCYLVWPIMPSWPLTLPFSPTGPVTPAGPGRPGSPWDPVKTRFNFQRLNTSTNSFPWFKKHFLPLSPFSPKPGGPASPRGPIAPSRPLWPGGPSGPGSPVQKGGETQPMFCLSWCLLILKEQWKCSQLNTTCTSLWSPWSIQSWVTHLPRGT